MLELLNTKIFDNERNVLNAELFVGNLKHTLEAFKFDTKITYEVYRNITVYYITWFDDKTFEDILELKKEIALSLGVNVNEFDIEKISSTKAKIEVLNMKRSTLSLKELLEVACSKDKDNIPLGLSQEDAPVYFNIKKDKNLLVAGVTGTGKTNLFNNIILNILMNKDNTKIVILDSQSINYNRYNKVCEVVNEEDKIIKKIKEIRHIFEEKVKNNNKDRIIVFIDEIYEIIKMDMSVKDDINYLLEVGSTMNIHIIISTDSVLDEDINYLFDKDDISKLSLYLTTRGEYNKFLDKYISESLGKDGIYASIDSNLTRISLPLIEDDEIERVVTYLENN